MIVIHDTAQPGFSGSSVVTIGKFDGFHRGHQRILAEAKACCAAGEPLVVFTFTRSPQAMITGSRSGNLLTRAEAREAAAALGVDVLVEYPFTEETRHITAEEFLERILLKELHMHTIVAGPDCRFGYERRGNLTFLEEQRRGRYEVRRVEKEQWRGEAISSTRIRDALTVGMPEDAREMLGHPFSFHGTIVHGRALGRQMGFPTINLEVSPEKLVPRKGVYAVWVKIDGKTHIGVANVGVKPTISGVNAVGVESYIYHFREDVYGKEAEVSLAKFIRPERRFASLQELQQQVTADKEQVLQYWGEEA